MHDVVKGMEKLFCRRLRLGRRVALRGLQARAAIIGGRLQPLQPGCAGRKEGHISGYRRIAGLVPTPDGYLWDPWFCCIGPTIHVFYLFQPAPGSMSHDAVFARERPTIAHATWSRGEGWVYKGTAIGYTGQPYDAERIHTGCVVEHEGSFYMLYSGSNRFVCLAQSDDLERVGKSTTKPGCLSGPGHLSGALAGSLGPSRLSFGQLHDGPGCAAGQRGGAVGTVAVAHSSDLRRWRQDAPLQVPDWFEWMEVPEVHCIDGTWYLLFVTRRKWVTARGVAALRAQGLDSRDGAYYLMASSWRALTTRSGFCRSNYRTLIRLVCCGAQRPSTGFGPTSRRTGTGSVIFGLRPPAPCTVAAGGGLLVTTLPPPAKSASSRPEL